MSKTPIEIVGRWRRYRDRRDKGVEWRAWESLGPLQGEGDEFVLLWSLALEVDEHRATRTGERVCRACGGRGVKITRLSTSITIWHEPDPDGFVRTLTNDPCRCTGPTRPHTVSLRRLVSTLASWRSPIVTDWPEQWAVNRDRMEAANWGEVTLPGDDRPTPAWVCQWWRAFGEWTAAGKVSDVGALAKALESRIKRAVPIPASFVVTDDDVRALNNAHDIRAAIIAQHEEWIADGWMQDAGAATITGGDVVSVGSPPAPHWVTPHDAAQWFNDDRERIGRALADLNDGKRMLVMAGRRDAAFAGLLAHETNDQQRTATAHRLLDSADMGERIIAGLWLRMDMVHGPPGMMTGGDYLVVNIWPLRRRSLPVTQTAESGQFSDSYFAVRIGGCDADEIDAIGQWLDRPQRRLTP